MLIPCLCFCFLLTDCFYVFFQARTAAGFLREKISQEAAARDELKAFAAEQDNLLEKVRMLQARNDELFTEVGTLKVEMSSKVATLNSRNLELELVKKTAESRCTEIAELKASVAELKQAAELRESHFMEKAQMLYASFCSVMEGVGANMSGMVAEGEPLTKESFFAWLAREVDNLPAVLDGFSDYGALFTTEAALTLLDHEGCDYIDKLLDSDLVVDEKARDGAGPSVRQSARRVALHFWRSFGHDIARQYAAERKAAISFESCGVYFLLSLVVFPVQKPSLFDSNLVVSLVRRLRRKLQLLRGRPKLRTARTLATRLPRRLTSRRTRPAVRLVVKLGLMVLRSLERRFRSLRI